MTAPDLAASRRADAPAARPTSVEPGSGSPATARALVVMPAFNEADSIASVVSDLRACGWDVVVVDDGSADDTGALAAAAGATVLPLPFNLGIGGALRCGFRYAVERGYDLVVQVDADGQHRAADVAVLVDAARSTQAHLVIGSRFAADAGYEVAGMRRFAMRMLAGLASQAANTRLTDASSGLRAIAEPLLSEFARSYTVHYMDSFEAVIVSGRAGYRVAEVPVTMHQRSSGTSSAGSLAALAFLARGVIVSVARLGFPIRPLSPRSSTDRTERSVAAGAPGPAG